MVSLYISNILYEYKRRIKPMEDKIVFEDYGIEFTDKDFEGVDIEILKKYKEKISKMIEKLENE